MGKYQYKPFKKASKQEVVRFYVAISSAMISAVSIFSVAIMFS